MSEEQQTPLTQTTGQILRTMQEEAFELYKYSQTVESFEFRLAAITAFSQASLALAMDSDNLNVRWTKPV